MIFLLTLILTSYTSAPVTDGGDGLNLIVNEIMISPLSSSSTHMGQWIELYNNSDEWVNLADWTIQNENNQEINFNTILIPPDEYFVVGASAITSENGNYTPDAVWGAFTLSVEGSLLLKKTRTDTQEFFSWNNSWDICQGTSLERINPGWAADDRDSWCHSSESYGNGDNGTPGEKNSVYSDGFGQNSWAFIKAFVH